MDLSGTGTAINYGSGNVIKCKKFSQTQYKIVYLISFIKKIFNSHFTIILMKLLIFFCVKKVFCVTVFLNCAFYGKDLETGTKAGTGTRTGTVTCQKWEPEP